MVIFLQIYSYCFNLQRKTKVNFDKLALILNFNCIFWLAVFTEIGLKAFKTRCINVGAWCNREKEITYPQSHLTYYMVNFEQMLVLSETLNVNILNQNLTL